MDDKNGQISTEGKPVEELSASEQPIEQVEGQLPDNAKEQTKQEFEKLKAHNKELSEKLKSFEEKEQQPQFSSVLDEMPSQSQAFSNLSTSQVEDITKGLVDQDGYIDQNLLDKTLKEASERAKRAEDRAMLAEQRIEKFEETQLVRDVHAKHPALDPYNPNFNREFYDKVKNEIKGQLSKGYQDFQAAADKVAAELQTQSSSNSSEVAKEEEKAKILAQREQANTTGGGKRVLTQEEHVDLDDGIRKGDSLSIGQALQASGF